MDLSGLRIWITRPQDAAKASEVRWRAAGATTLVEPLVELVDQEPSAEAARAFGALTGPWTLILTSPRAAQCFLRWSQRHPGPLAPAHVCAIGPATADAATQVGFTVSQVAGRATGADLGHEVGGPGPVVYPASAARAGDVEQALASVGRTVLGLTLYGPQNRALTPGRWDELVEAADLVALYAPSAAAALAEGFGSRRGDVLCAALGPTTHAAATALGLRVAVTASDPGEAHLIDEVRAWWSAR
jgi:uroporphyrinogen-III synthase